MSGLARRGSIAAITLVLSCLPLLPGHACEAHRATSQDSSGAMLHQGLIATSEALGHARAMRGEARDPRVRLYAAQLADQDAAARRLLSAIARTYGMAPVRVRAQPVIAGAHDDRALLQRRLANAEHQRDFFTQAALRTEDPDLRYAALLMAQTARAQIERSRQLQTVLGTVASADGAGILSGGAE